MNSKNELDEVLAELRAKHREVKAPPGLESLLRAEAARRAGAGVHTERKRRWAWSLSAALLVLLVVAAVGLRLHRAPVGNEAHVLVTPQRSEPDLADRHEELAKNETTKLPAPEHQAKPPAVGISRQPAADRHPEPQENQLADFIPLPASEGLPPALALSLVRMRIEQSSLQQYGLEVPAENGSRTLLAEFAVGDDGLPRAIRILP